MENSKRIRLNLQGTIKETYLETIQKIPMLAAMFSGNFRENPEQEVFIDRNPENFQLLLDAIVNNNFVFPNKLHLQQDLDFYGINSYELIDTPDADSVKLVIDCYDNNDKVDYHNNLNAIIEKEKYQESLVTQNLINTLGPCVKINEHLNYNNSAKIIIGSECDAIETPFYLELNFMPLNDNQRWKSRVGLDIIKSVLLTFNSYSITIDHQTLELEYLFSDKEMYEIFEYDEDSIEKAIQISKKGLKTIIPINLLSYEPQSTICLIASRFTRFTVELEFNKLRDYIITPTNTGYTYPDLQFKLIVNKVLYDKSIRKQIMDLCYAIPINEIIKFQGTDIYIIPGLFIQDMFIITGKEDCLNHILFENKIISWHKLKYAIWLKKNLLRFSGIYYYSFVNKERKNLTFTDYKPVGKGKEIQIILKKDHNVQPIVYIRTINNICYAAGCVTKKILI